MLYIFIGVYLFNDSWEDVFIYTFGGFLIYAVIESIDHTLFKDEKYNKKVL